VLPPGPAAVVYAVADLVVDRYEEVVASLEFDVDEVEASVFSDNRTRDSARIYALKRELAEVRRAVVPLRDSMRRFFAGATPHVSADTVPFFRDVADHLTRVTETVDALDGLLSAAFEAHLAAISIQQNEDVRKISASVGLVAVLPRSPACTG
jgi:magnesium transporter